MQNIRSAEELRSAIEEAERIKGPSHAPWREDLARFLSDVANASEQERASLDFQQRLWETNPVTDVGMGTVKVDAALADEEFRRWLASASLRALPARERSAERVDALAKLADEILEKLAVHGSRRSEAHGSRTSEAHGSRKPVLKLYRVLAAFFPEDFTTISDVRRLRDLHQAMFGKARAASPCHQHDEILRRLDEVSGGVSDLKGDFVSLADRMSRPWLVYESAVRPEPEEEEEEEEETGVVVGVGIQPPTLSVPAAVDVVSRINAGENPFPPSTIVTLHAGLWASHRRHFAVLTGLSGSGKTQLARAYARALLGTDANASRRFLAVAVQPGWYDPSPLVGYVNPLRGGSYMRPKFLDLLIQAGRDPANAYVALLDEMNLSHPEQYLAPLLSAMELEDGVIELHGQADALDRVPTSIPYPQNLVLIGTVNMDETTHGLSDKVLDRAFTLEFWDINLADYPRWTGRALTNARVHSARRVLEALLAALAPARLHFGWRVVDDVLDFLVQTEAAGDALGEDQALDTVVYTKILPKLRGDDSRRFREALERSRKALEEHALERSARKVQELQQDLETTGSARFWR